jgi:acyl-CoA thioesterase I
MTHMTDAPKTCTPFPELIKFNHPLRRLTEALERQPKIKIVAIGSSSTVGANSVVPFPYRLEQALRSRYYGRVIDILNRGVGGQEAPEELSRFECDVFAENPTLVIWQVGTNAVFHKADYDFNDVERAIAVGLDWLAIREMEVILMDLQYTQAIVNLNKPPAEGEKPIADDIEDRIATVAKEKGVNLFSRWALMKRWCEAGVPLPEMDDGGQYNLHTSNWATQCITTALDLAIGARVGALTGAVTPPTI